MAESLEFSVDLPVFPERVFRAWFDSAEHSKFTGQAASIQQQVGGKFSGMAGGVEGQIITISPYDHIVQTWRTKEGPADSADSQIDIRLEPTCTGTQFVLVHTGIPNGQSRQVLSWWENKYLRPMRRYFEELVGDYVEDIDG